MTVRAVDFDRTTASYDVWRGQLVLGEPVPAMVERVKAWLAGGDEVFVYTARIAEEDGFGHLNDAGTEATTVAIQDWCERHLGARLRVVAKASFGELWDDKAVQVFPNTGLTVLDVLRRRQLDENAAGKTYASSVLREVIEEIERLTKN